MAQTDKALSWFDRLTIIHRLALIGILAAVGMLIAGLIHNQSVSSINQAADKVTSASELMETLDGLTSDVFVEFDAASRYLKFSEKEGKQTWEQYSARNDKAIDQLIEVLPLQDLRDEAEILQQSMQHFDSKFIAAAAERMVLGLNKNEGDTGKLRKAVHAAEAKLKEHKQPELMVSMLMLRRHEKDFMLRHNEKYLIKFHKEIKHFNRLLRSSGLESRVKDDIRSEMDNYNQTFDGYVSKFMHLLTVEKELEAIYKNELLANLNALDDDFVDYIDTINAERATVQKEQTITFWGTLLLILLAIGGLIAWITRSISVPLEAVVEAMNVLEKGEIRHVEQTMGGEIGDLVESLEIFQKQTAETFMLRQVVETSPQATMIADKDTLVVNYMNPAALALFQNIQGFLPCPAANIVGSCIDIFHKNPAHQRGLLSATNNFPHYGSFVADDRSIEFSAYALHNSAGQWESIMVSWDDVTEQVALADDFESSVGVVVEEMITAATQMQASSEALSAMAEESTHQAESVADGATEANHNVTNVASAAEELSASIAEISRQVDSAVDISAQAVVEAEETNQTVEKLSSVSEEIGQVVRVITDIAEQTNLLALNASIEAARAGEAGRGFAVVAGEVKELANQTARATEQISTQIQAIQRESTGAATAIGKIGETIQEMNSINQSIAAATEEQNNATREIAQSVQYASDATMRVTEAIDGVSSAAEDTGRSAVDVMNVSGMIRDKGEDLSVRVTSFLDSLRKQ